MNKTDSNNSFEDFTHLDSYEVKLPYNNSWCSDELSISPFEWVTASSISSPCSSSNSPTGLSSPNDFISIKTNYSFSNLDKLLYTEYDPYKTLNLKQLSELYFQTYSLNSIQKMSDFLRTRINTLLDPKGSVGIYNTQKARLESLKSHVASLKSKISNMASKISEKKLKNDRERERIKMFAKNLQVKQYTLMKNWNDSRDRYKTFMSIQTIRLDKITKARSLLLKWWLPDILDWFGLRASSVYKNKYKFSCIDGLVPSNIYDIEKWSEFQMVFDVVTMIIRIYASAVNIPLMYSFDKSRQTGGLVINRNGSKNKYDLTLETSKKALFKHLLSIIEYLRFQTGNTSKFNHNDVLKNVIDLIQFKFTVI